jgi:hypothetical protein
MTWQITRLQRRYGLSEAQARLIVALLTERAA